MTSANWPADASSDQSPFRGEAAKQPSAIDRTLESISEYLNPILVKEGRQAFKSFQFFYTFLLLLLVGWAWSMLGVTYRLPGIYYVPAGPMMLVGYFWILAFPLLVVIPFASFLSFANERNDGTYELVSITTLSSLQIILGKLGSSMVQMLIYLSALSPCLAFTYMLRGIDILTIFLLILYSFLASVALSAIALLLATMTRGGAIQGFLMVALGGELLFSFFTFCASGTQMALTGMFPLDQSVFWVFQLCSLSFFVALLSLICLAAAARIAPASDNRSTRLRICMLVVQLLLTGWFTYAVFATGDEEWLFGLILLTTIFWYVMGVFMTSESPIMSERVKRGLPKSFLGRVLLTWFNPGPGNGYMFAAGNMMAMAIMTPGLMLAAAGRTGTAYDGDIEMLAMLSCCYVIVYLGAVRLIISVVRRLTYCGMLLGPLIHLVWLVVGIVAALIIQWGFFYEFNYSPLHIPNPFWTLAKAAEGNIDVYTTPWLPGVPIVLPVLAIGAVALLFANLFAVAGALQHVHKPVPQRVIADELELHPVAELPPTPTNPWNQDIH